MQAIVDYGVGNLYSLQCSLRRLGKDSVVTGDPEALRRAERVILPGVGAFGDAMDKLRALRLDALLCELACAGKPILGVCLGMQLLFEESLEYGAHKGLALIPGRVVPLQDALPAGAKVPHMGWNDLIIVKPDEPLLRACKTGDDVYYVHSYYAVGCEPFVCAYSDYLGARVPGVVRKGCVCGAQFHPEKSGGVGLSMLKAFCEVCV